MCRRRSRIWRSQNPAYRPAHRHPTRRPVFGPVAADDDRATCFNEERMGRATSGWGNADASVSGLAEAEATADRGLVMPSARGAPACRPRLRSVFGPVDPTVSDVFRVGGVGERPDSGCERELTHDANAPPG